MAEKVTEIAEKPLYHVTCGEIGIEPDEVEGPLFIDIWLCSSN